MAGTFRGSDSWESNAALVKTVKQIRPTVDIELVEERKPFDIVEHIASARVAIGTSLHVRIVASSYGISRVSLLDIGRKVSNYVKHWDPHMPHDVPMENLNLAVRDALSAAHRRLDVKHSSDLSNRAHSNLMQLAEQAITLARRQTSEDRARIHAAREELLAGARALPLRPQV